MDFDWSQLARILVLLALGWPAVSFWRDLRRNSPRAANRYVFGIIAMFAWTVLGVVLMVLILPAKANNIAVLAAIAFLVSWIGVCVAWFVKECVPPQNRHYSRRQLQIAMLVLGGLAAVCGLIFSLAA